MVGDVSMQRTFGVLAFGLLAGGVVGAYATTTVYGQRSPPPPAPKAAACAPCPVCPTCPPPVDCAAPPAVGSDEITDLVEAPADPVVGLEPEIGAQQWRGAGLPASAIGMASKALSREIQPCLQTAREAGASGSMVLDLTVTATGGVGHIRHAEVASSDTEDPDLAPCLIGAAGQVQFDWPDADGESRLRYPVRVGGQ